MLLLISKMATLKLILARILAAALCLEYGKKKIEPALPLQRKLSMNAASESLILF